MVYDILDLKESLPGIINCEVFYVNSFLLYCQPHSVILKSELKSIIDILPDFIDFFISNSFIIFYVSEFY